VPDRRFTLVRSLALATLIPAVAGAVQWALWDVIRPYVWFLFYPAVFLASWATGIAGGIWATVLSAGIVLYVFVPPQFSFVSSQPSNYGAALMFAALGVLFTFTHERLRRTSRSAGEALASSEQANRDLLAAKQQAETLYRKTVELDSLKSRFFAGVSHDLRTPLTLVLGPLEDRLKRKDLPARESEELRVMVRNARLLRDHVDDLVDAGRLEAGTMPIDYASIDMCALVRLVASHFANAAAEKRVSFDIDAPASLQAEVDPEKLRRVLMNLLANAFRFTPPNGAVRLKVSAADDDLLSVEVRDTGPGVPEEWREAIFERYQRVDTERPRAGGGVGLGLAIAREFLELHGGTVAVCAAPEGGACFVLTLPLRAPDGARVNRSPSALEDGLARATLLPEPSGLPATPPAGDGADADAPLVLVVEDDRDMNAYVAGALRPRYRVASAFDGSEGLAQALQSPPALVVTDLLMPGMSGADLIQALRWQPQTADIPVVVLTGKADDDLRVRLLREGAQDYLYKPFSPAELVARVDRLVAERTRAERLLKESEERLRLSLAGTRAGMWDWYVQTGRLVVDEGWTRMLGYSPTDLVPITIATWESLCHPEDFRKASDLLEECFRHGRPHYECELRMRRKSGEWTWVLDRGQVVEWDETGRPVRMTGAHLDISGRKEAERRLDQRQRDYRALAETLALERGTVDAIIERLPVGVAISDARGTFLVMNSVALALHGFRSPEEMLRSTEEFGAGWTLYDRDGRALAAEEWPAARALAGEYVREMEVQVERIDGGRRFCRYNVAPVLDAHGAVALIVYLIQDITNSRQAEVALQESHERLRQAQKMEAVGQLAGGVAHDFNNLLLLVLGSATLADATLGERHPAREHVAEITKAGERAATLVNQLLAFSRRQVMQPERLDLNELVAGFLKLLKRVIGEHIRLGFVPDGSAAVDADRGMLEQVLLNLCVNARDAIGAGGTLTIATGRALLDEAACTDFPSASPGPHAWLSVTDTGSGMDAETLSRVFEPFFSTKPPGQGTGLGLATVYGIVSQHSGLIRAQSEPGKGTTFTVYLPESSGRAALETPAPAPAPAGSGETILVAEDSDPVRSLVARILTDAGYTVVEAANGTDAIAAWHAAGRKVDLLLLDVVMPDVSGREVHERIARESPDVPVVFTSGYTAEVVHGAFKLPEDVRLLRKPFKRDQLLRVVREALDQGSGTGDQGSRDSDQGAS
jgi:PAS domain S-box-containing protein